MNRLEGNADAEVRRLALTLGVDILRPNSDGLGPYIDWDRILTPKSWV